MKRATAHDAHDSFTLSHADTVVVGELLYACLATDRTVVNRMRAFAPLPFIQTGLNTVRPTAADLLPSLDADDDVATVRPVRLWMVKK